MREALPLEDRGRGQAQPISPSRGARPGARHARALFVTGLAWAAVVVASWLAWWALGSEGREALAGTVGLSAAQLTPYVMTALVAEKLAAKGLLFAALYHWVKGT